MVRVFPRERRRAIGLGVKASSSIASWTRCRVASLTLGLSLMTRETVPKPTPAFLATSRMVAGITFVCMEPVPLGVELHNSTWEIDGQVLWFLLQITSDTRCILCRYPLCARTKLTAKDSLYSLTHTLLSVDLHFPVNDPCKIFSSEVQLPSIHLKEKLEGV